MADLSIRLFGRVLKNPVMNASGTFGYGVEIESLWNIETMGAYVTKGLSLKPHHGNPTPRVYEVTGGLINSIGLQNIGIEAFFRDYMPFFEKKQMPVIVNFFGFTEDEYVECARNIIPHELIVGIEMNLSCPNIKAGGIGFGKEPKTVRKLISRIKAVTKLPVIAKLSPEVNSISDIAIAAYDGGADGLTLINTMPGVYVDINRKTFAIKGGLSGPSLKPMALKAIYECRKKVPLPIIGAGGIMEYEDCIAFLMAGATAVQIGTATFVDPFTIPKVIKDCEVFLNKNNISAIGDIIGKAEGV
ncbi:MAG TPA: dihydroorotate dehydrogenase [Syntrophorhabdaceae bacterium]|nr:dihydroorotate dehydrogenase [Syntrophorhabdaceae bacterium]